MGILDDVRASFGDDFFDRSQEREPTHRWNELCVCGHIDRYHSPSIGGTYRIPEPFLKKVRGEDVTVTTAFYGCVGALKIRGFEELTSTDVDREARTMVNRVNPTCPCIDFRPVAKVDRPNRYFNQRMPKDPSDPMRHPFLVGIRAFRTFLSGRVQAKKDDRWAEREFDRRFVWLEGKQVCSMSRCKETGDGVYPGFVNDDRLSELRCGPHRPAA
jgi:hypothetical protein